MYNKSIIKAKPQKKTKEITDKMFVAVIGAVTDLDRPPTPFNVTVRPFHNSLHISWSVPTSDRPADYHIVEYRTVGQWVPLTDRIAVGVNAYNWTTASRGATYHFRVIGLYDRPADSASPGSDEAPAVPDDDDGQSPLPWQQSLPSAVITIETGGEFCLTGCSCHHRQQNI